MNKDLLKRLEEHAFYESGLSAHGCLEILDSYALEAIKKYGRILLQKQKENIVEGFQGCCYTCEPVGMLNQQLEAQLKDIEEYGTEEINSSIDLRQKLAQSLLENEKLKKLCRKLYGTVLHVHALAKEDPIVLIGPELYKEAYNGIKEYEKIELK